MYYTSDGYIDFKKLLYEDKSIFKFIVGARGVGKTFGILKYMLEYDYRFIYMRRTQTQVDMVRTDQLNPFKAIYTELGADYDVVIKPMNTNMSALYRPDPEDEERKPQGLPIGYMLALSTVSNIRGFDASDIDYLIYDEFIGEKHEKPIREEGAAFLNAYETINRNRELKGRRPVKAILLSNSTNMANPIFVTLKVITPLEKMIKKHSDHLYLPDRGISIYNITDSPISRKKANTALYRLTGTDSDFAQMALSNEFNKEYTGMVKTRKLSEFNKVATAGEITIWKHKSRREWYVTEAVTKAPDEYDGSDIELKRFANDHYYLKLAYLNRHVYFQSYIQQVLYEQYLKI